MSEITAGIDLGSNSFRLLIGHAADGAITPLVKRTVTVRLGEGLAPGGCLRPNAVARARDALPAFRRQLERHPPRKARACGTQALRAAADGDTFIRRAARILGVAASVIPAEEEARLTLTGCLSAFAAPPRRLLLVDAGGASTEFVIAAVNNAGVADIAATASLPIGAVNLTERFLATPSRHQDTSAAAAWIADQIGQCPILASGGVRSLEVVACGGTATALAALDLGLAAYDEDRVQGHIIETGDLEGMIKRLAGLSPDERNTLAGLDNRRGEIILAGALILAAAARITGHGRVTVSDRGLLEGIALSASEPFF